MAEKFLGLEIRSITSSKGVLFKTLIQAPIKEGIEDTSHYRNLSGQRFGKILCVAPFGTVRKSKNIVWECLCDCGVRCLLSIRSFSPKKSVKSCGCSHRDILNARKGNGATKIPGYRSWRGMKQRCFNPLDDGYKLYGGRGITVCERWRTSFLNFISDMGQRPSGKHSIERVDTNGNYEPSNCVWALPEAQCNNRRNTHIIVFNGLKMSREQWARKIGVDPTTIKYRLEKGLPLELVLQPKKPRRIELCAKYEPSSRMGPSRSL